ncbi:MAG: zf-HC2 domain-containing protein [Gemmatimonadaceae bacterium]
MPNETRHIDCTMAMKQLWDYLDQELTDDRMSEVQQHLAHCQRCFPHADFAQRFLEALQSTREERPMPAEMRARVMQRLSETGFSVN